VASTRLKRGIEPLIAAVIVTAVGIAIAVAVSMWMLGVIGQTGYGTRPVELDIYGDLKVRGNEFYLLVKNLGGDDVIVDDVILQGKYHSIVIEANNLNGENRLSYDDGSYTILVKGGETIEIHGVVDKQLNAGQDVEVTLHTVYGLGFHKVMRANLAPLTSQLLAYDTTMKDPNNPDKHIVLVSFSVSNRGTSPIKVFKVEIAPLQNPLSTIEEIKLNIDVSPGSTWRPSRLRDFTKTTLTPGKYVVKVWFSKDSVNDTIAGIVEVKPTALRVYAIKTDDISCYINSGLALSILQSYADVELIETRAQLYDFIVNPVEGSVLVNLHGEVVPIPGPNDIGTHRYIKTDPPDSFNQDDNWKLTDEHINGTFDPPSQSSFQAFVSPWFEDIGRAVREHGIIWVGTAGWNNYYVANREYSGWTNYHGGGYSLAVRDGGNRGLFNITDQWVQHSLKDWGDPPYDESMKSNYTDLVEDLAWLFNDTSILVNLAPASRPVHVSFASQAEYVFYETNNSEKPYAAAAFRVGKGFIIINGWAYSSFVFWSETDPPLNDVNDRVDFVTKLAMYETLYVWLMENILSS